jgi:tRNA threonylcarbamoyladenosine modification (KEOPS) complex  Pcc1 subunit
MDVVGTLARAVVPRRIIIIENKFDNFARRGHCDCGYLTVGVNGNAIQINVTAVDCSNLCDATNTFTTIGGNDFD